MINIESTPHSRYFKEIIQDFPHWFQKLSTAPKNQIGEFFKKGNGVAAILKSLGQKEDIPGIMFFTWKISHFTWVYLEALLEEFSKMSRGRTILLLRFVIK